MIRSMTGYGLGQMDTSEFGKVVIEVQGVNRKYLDIYISMPKEFLPVEDRIRHTVQTYVERGRINVWINATIPVELRLNEHLIKNYLKMVAQLKKKFNLIEDINLSTLLNMKDVFVFNPRQLTNKKLWKFLFPPLKEALEGFISTKEKEGQNLLKDIKKYMQVVENKLLKIKRLIPKINAGLKDKMLKRLSSLQIEISPNDEQIIKEIGFLVDKTDVSEEITRLESHIEYMKGIILGRNYREKKRAVGKELDFILQEMFREINTLGNKIADSKISKEVVFIKSSLEKMREQVQNIE